MRLINADTLKTGLTRFYDNEVTAKQLIDEQPTIEAIPVEWIRSQLKNNPNDIESAYDDICINELIERWQKEQEAGQWVKP